MAMQKFVPGQQLGHYRLLNLLGQGGFADVYLGDHIHLNTLAAVKVLHTRLADDDVQLFRREAQVVARLQHANIIRVFDFGVEEGVPYLVMDHAPNGTLRRRHARGTRVPIADVVTYVKQVGSALQYAHEQRIIHRDVKPENMLVGRAQEILLSDFGIALVTQSSYVQSTQNIAGTIAYMAPEQIQAHPLPASDQYSLGIIAYEWLSGMRPFQGSYTEIAIKHSTVAPPPLRTVVPDIPVEIEYVVMTALHKDPQQRFPSVGMFAHAFERAAQQGMQRQFMPTFVVPAQPMNGASQQAAQTSFHYTNPMLLPASSQFPYSLKDSERRSAGSQGGNGVLSTPLYTPQMAPGQGAWGAQQAYATPGQPMLPPGHPLQAYGAPGQSVLPSAQPPQGRGGISRRALLAAGASGLVLLGIGGVVGWSLIERLHTGLGATAGGESPLDRMKNTVTQGQSPVRGSTVLTYGGHTGIVWRVRWSPDGKYIASGSMDNTLQIWTADGGEKKDSTRSLVQPARSDDYPWSLAWAPLNRQRVAVGFVDSTIQLLDMTSHQRQTVITNSSAALAVVAWSPDEKFLAAGWSDGSVVIYDTTSWQSVLTYSGHTDTVYSVAWSPDGKYVASGSQDTTVRLWEPGSGKTLLVYTGHSDTVMSVSWSPDSTRIVSTGCDDETAKTWNVLSGQTLYTYTLTAGGPIGEAAWSHNGKVIALYGAGAVILLDAQKGSVTETIQTGVVYSLSWSPDDTRLVTADYDKTARIWQTSS